MKKCYKKEVFYICKCGEDLEFDIINDWYKCSSCGIIYVELGDDQKIQETNGTTKGIKE